MDNTVPFAFYGGVFFILGLLLGSYANVVIYRLPLGLSTIKPRSHCFNCKKQVAWYDNIPVLSWFLLRGKCRSCGAKFSWRYPLVELLTGSLFLALFIFVGFKWVLLEYLIFAFSLIVVSFIDFDHMILPDRYTLSGIVIGLIGAFTNPEREFFSALGGVLLGGGFLWAIAYVYFTLRKQDGLGGGDIKLLAWIGAVLGWKAIPFVILSSSLVGTIIGFIVMSRSKSGLSTAIPFGPYLALGALLYILGGESLADWYLNLFIPSLSPVN